MSLEDTIADLNKFFFFREFTFSKNTFRPTPNKEVELADNVVWLDDILVVYQIKEREALGDSTSKKEEQWFKRTVLHKATRQVRNTLEYLNDCSEITLRNHRGHEFNLSTASLKSIRKILIYRPHALLPEHCRSLKHYRSQTAGVIHLISANDYVGILQNLITPCEVSEYLQFRENLIDRWEHEILAVPEQALVGQYLHGDSAQIPNAQFADYLKALRDDRDEWDLSRMMYIFADQIIGNNDQTDYYRILAEIAKLHRGELREFKKRLLISKKECKSDKPIRPLRMVSARTGCGFVFIPVSAEYRESQRQGLKNFTYAHKYDQGLSKCIGISFIPEEGGWYSIDWCLMEFPWREDPDMDERLRVKNPFGDVRIVAPERYKFNMSNE